MTLHVDWGALNGRDDAEVCGLEAAAAPGSPTGLVAVRGGGGRLLRAEAPPVLVVGSSGGSGTTTTTLGLAAAAASCSDGELWPVAVDATLGGGDLAARGCDAVAAASSLQSWLATDQPQLPSTVSAFTGATSTGAAVLARTPDPLPGRQSYVAVHRHLEAAGALPIYDAGAPVSNRLVSPLLADPRIALVITVAARADALNRLIPVLRWLDDHFGQFHIADAVLVVTQQIPGAGSAAIHHLRAHLGAWVRSVVAIPYDLHLAEGGPVSWHRLAGHTRAAYVHLMGDLR
ncbi:MULTISPECIES: MinD/ParA family ATP-binding protein [Nocardia]|uniref:MinD/ParA family ATP-binding protein n=1 Tax=Nocardia TaxID=1817 RepID=UPI00245500D0|nr:MULTISPECIES: hypothetical protein [Nocardia]